MSGLLEVMGEQAVARLVNAMWLAYDAGVEQDAVVAEIKAQAATPEEIPAALEKMANEALGELAGKVGE